MHFVAMLGLQLPINKTCPFGAHHICVMEINVDTGMREIRQFYAL